MHRVIASRFPKPQLEVCWFQKSFNPVLHLKIMKITNNLSPPLTN